MEIPAHAHWDRECRSRIRRRAGRVPPGTGATWEAASSDIPDGLAGTADPTSKSYEDRASSTCVRVRHTRQRLQRANEVVVNVIRMILRLDDGAVGSDA